MAACSTATLLVRSTLDKRPDRTRSSACHHGLEPLRQEIQRHSLDEAHAVLVWVYRKVPSVVSRNSKARTQPSTARAVSRWSTPTRAARATRTDTSASWEQQERRDGHDVIEAIAKKEWCNGNVALAGNSHLAICQWFIAAEAPPSLKCIAPWEACSDLFREQFVRGGIWDYGLFGFIEELRTEAATAWRTFPEMHRRNPLSNPYWEDKRADFSKIRIPAYITSSYSALVHTVAVFEDSWSCRPTRNGCDGMRTKSGTISGLSASRSTTWPSFSTDTSRTSTTAGSETLPRCDCLCSSTARVLNLSRTLPPDYPLQPETQYRKMFLQSNGTLSTSAPKASSVVSYDSESPSDFAGFTYTFEKDQALAGLVRANLYLSCDDMDDMEIYVIIRKLDKSGKEMLNFNLPWSSVPIKSFKRCRRARCRTWSSISASGHAQGLAPQDRREPSMHALASVPST